MRRSAVVAGSALALALGGLGLGGAALAASGGQASAASPGQAPTVAASTPAPPAQPSAAQATTTEATAKPGGAPVTVEFKGADLGMSLADWRALPFPDAAPEPITPICSDQSPPGRAGLTLTRAEAQAGVTACTYVSSQNQGLDFPRAMALNERYNANDVRYLFVGGRLAQIAYWSSEDAFDAVTARLRAAYGAPSQVRRESMTSELGISFPRVRMTWRTPQAVITLTDPAPRPGRLAVSYTARAAGAALMAGGDGDRRKGGDAAHGHG